MLPSDERTPQPGQLRPDTMWIDPDTCIECGICEEVAPGMRVDEHRIAVSPQTLEAMSACPTGAIRWLEGEEDR